MLSTKFLLASQLLLVSFFSSSFVGAVPNPQTSSTPSTSSGYWVSSISRQGTVAYGSDSNYQIFRNVKDFGAKGDGVSDDTLAINSAVSTGNRCGQGCDSSTTTPAIVYFPPGTYVVSAPIIQYYYTQFIGDAISLPTIKASSAFQGLAIIDSDPYIPGGNGANWYTNQNNFFRQIRNFVIDLTGMPINSSSAGIHWQVAQATSLQNIRFEMLQGGGANNKQQGIFMDNGSGGFMSDLIFNGGLIGAFLGNQQFTSRNLTFNGCQTAIFMNWNWLWTFKSVSINNCEVGLQMSKLDVGNQTVGSVLLIDSKITATPIGVQTSFNSSSIPKTGGTLVIDNVDFTGAMIAVAALDGSQILAGGSIVESWAQGDAYQPIPGKRRVKRVPQVPSMVTGGCTAASQIPLGSPSSSPPLNISTPVYLSSSAPGTITLTSTIPFNSSVASNSISSFYTMSLPSSSALFTSSATTTSILPVPASSFLTSAPLNPSPTLSLSTSPMFLNSSASATASFPSGSMSANSSVSMTCAAVATRVTQSRIQQQLTPPTIPEPLVAGSKIFERSKPQYESVPASSFISVKSNGAKGDGVTDDTDAIQSVLNKATSDQVVYFDHGAYIITKTINVPKDIRITGEIWPLIMASGTEFSDQTNPKPVFRVGMPGDHGAVEISDLIFETLGPAPGAIMMEWNVADSSQGSCGLWDCHFRVGGSAGTQLQQDKCMGNTTDTKSFKPECAGSFLMLHVTQQATAYIENSWLWVADHELDLAMHNETSIYNGRGMLIESQGPVWLYGTSVEHSQLYNYQVANAKNIWMGAIQTETAYMQSAPNALDGGFTPNPAYSDPDFASCTTDSCKKTWGLRVVDSSDVYVLGGGLYSFFDDYTQECLATESCQDNMVGVECSSDVWMYGLTTKASVNMVTVNGQSAALGADNLNGFGQTIALFQQQ